MRPLIAHLLILPRATLMSSEPVARYEADKSYIAMREKALKTTASELHVAPKKEEAFGLVADIGMAEGAITVVVYRNGDASMYNSKGGARLGGRASQEIRKAVEKALSEASAEIPRMRRTSDFGVVLPGHSRVYVLTPEGVFSDEADAAHIDPGSPTYRLISAIDPVITGFRHLEPGYSR